MVRGVRQHSRTPRYTSLIPLPSFVFGIYGPRSALTLPPALDLM